MYKVVIHCQKSKDVIQIQNQLQANDIDTPYQP